VTGDYPHDAVRCDHCREVIGVYEPMIAVLDGEPVMTSCAAAELAQHARRYHGSCFAEVDEERTGTH
jgi:hypothetical protein